MHCRISPLPRRTKLHGYQNNPAHEKMGKSTDQPSLHSHGNTRFPILGFDSFLTWRIHLSWRMHLRASILVLPAHSSLSKFFQIQWSRTSSSGAIPIHDWQHSRRWHSLGLLWSTIVSSQIYICLWQAIQIVGTILLHLLPTGSDVFGSFPRGSSTSKLDYYQELWQNSISLPHNGPGHIILPATAGIPLLLLNSFLVLKCLPTIMNGGKLFVLHLSVKINKKFNFSHSNKIFSLSIVVWRPCLGNKAHFPLFISLSKNDNTIVVIPAMTQSLVMGYLFQIVYHISSKYFFQKPIPSESNQVFALQRASTTFDG